MKRILLVVSSLIILAFLIGARCNSQPKGTEVFGKTGKGDKITVDQMAKIAPGLGVIMMEMGERNGTLYYAGIDGNWDLAAYQLKELREAMEVAEVTRPKRKPGLESFDKGYLVALEEAIEAKDSAKFKEAFDNEVKGCNSCHVMETNDKGKNFEFIKWKIPDERPPYLETKLSK